MKLPLGLHRASLRRCPLLDDALRPIEDVATALARLQTTPDAAVDALAGQRVVALPGPRVPVPEEELLSDQPVELPAATTPRSLAERLRAIPRGAESEAAADRMLAGCEALAGIVSRAFEKRSLTADEARAVTYSLGLLGPDPVLARRVLVAAGASTRELDRATGGLPSPVGCVRLRKVAGACRGCPSQGTVLPYPSPVSYAVGSVEPAPPLHHGFAPFLEAPLAVPPPRDVRAALRAIEARLDALVPSAVARAPGPSDADDPAP